MQTTCCCSQTIASLESMVADCCGAYGRAGLGVGSGKTHWSSSIDLEGEVLHVLGQDTTWERPLEFIGSVIERKQRVCGTASHRESIFGVLQRETFCVRFVDFRSASE